MSYILNASPNYRSSNKVVIHWIIVPYTIRYLLTIVLLAILSITSFAQVNALIIGKIKNNNTRITEIDLQVNNRYLNNNIDNYQSKIKEDGTFAFGVFISEPQLVDLYYARNQALLYLEPNDTLYLDFDANTFNFSFEFSGKSGDNNTYLANYLKEHPRELNPFKYLQYKSGVFWHTVEPKKDEAMRTMTKTDYVKKMNLNKEANLSALNFYDKNNPNMLSPDFKEFLSTEIMYDWAYHMMIFGTVYKGMHALDDSFFSFLEKVPLQSDYIGSYYYRLFLLMYVNHEYLKIAKQGEIAYVEQYDLAPKLLGGSAMAFVQSEMIIKAFYKRYFDEILPAFTDFMENNPYIQFDDKIVNVYQKSTKTAIGTLAPEFVFDRGQNQKLTLSQMRGKIVFLNFWASWCRPCMKKMKELKPMQDTLSNDIVVVHVSFDKTSDQWTETVEENDFGGIHILAPQNVRSEIAKKYGVRVIPEYFIIDKEGKFAEKPLIFTAESLKEILTSLNTTN